MRNTMFSGLVVLGGLVGAVLGSSAAAATCGGTYTVKSGDSLSAIADSFYKDAGKWSAVHTNNLGVIGDSPNAIRVGMKLALSCIDGLPTGLPGGVEVGTVSAAAPLVEASGTYATRSKINLLTAGDYAPFTSPDLPNGGLLTDVVNSAMAKADPGEGYAIHWVEDWGSHLDPLLSNALLDLGFPWFKPDCESSPEDYRCANFHFSDPMFEMLILLFTDKADPVPFVSDADMAGRTLCRPRGYFTHDLDRADRRWITDGKITLKQPQTIKDCFEMLMDGEVDAVAINEFVGRTAMKDLELKDRVEIVQGRPVSIEGLHVLVHKSHPQADAMLATINAGLRGIKENGTYQSIIDTHMTRIWAEF
ncbi:transporter substrate-binding domain-containing protein [Pseudohalocynthiibacter aestuariivivens]|nr:transporter substrate-binding domain-containing protein [Pseudohalocynthiibacter aestuariivivens]QIE46741.1 transporter substrate-binding domain-containing protein [Pseudohalocynthiibacter aestuariivivens]